MKKLLVLLGVLCLLGSLTGGAATAAMLDQSQTNFDSGVSVHNNNHVAQTFAPGLTSTLDSIDLYLFDSDSNYPTNIEIVQGNPGSTTILGTTTITVDPSDQGWYNIDFSGETISLNAGATYSIVIYNNDSSFTIDPTFKLGINSSGGYANGEMWYKGFLPWQQSAGGSWDLAFKTYMQPVPIPSAMLLLGNGIAALAGLRRKYRKD